MGFPFAGTLELEGLSGTDLQQFSIGNGNTNILWILPSGDETGATDTANVADQAAAGTMAMILAPGIWYFDTTIGPLTTGQWIVCMPGVLINWLGTGDCFRWTDTSDYDARTTRGGGLIGCPVIDGASSGAGSSALHFGDILGFRFDVDIQNFDGAGDIGLHADNQAYWTEQAIGIAYLNNCTSFVVFDCGGADSSTGSFDRGDFTFFINQFNVAYNGIVWQNGAQQVGGRVRVFGNFETAASAPDSAVLTFTGTVPAGHPTAGSYAGLAQCELDVNVEGDEGHTYAPQTINFGAEDNAIVDCTGNVSFGTAFAFQESNVTATTTQFVFTGQVIGDPTLAVQTVPGRLSVSGESFFFSEMFLGEIGTTPSTPADGLVLWVDNSTGNLHYLGASGVTGVLGSGGYLCTPSSYAPSPAQSLMVQSSTFTNFGIGTTVAAGSNGGEISQIASWAAPSAGVLDVASTTSFPGSGTINVVASGTTLALINYTGTTGTSFTGCTYVSGSATGTVATGGQVSVSSVQSLTTGNFTAPASGSVVVEVSLAAEGVNGEFMALALAAAGTVTPLVSDVVEWADTATAIRAYNVRFLVTGLTAGDTYDLALLGACTLTGPFIISAYGQTATTPATTRGAPVLITVQAV